MQTSCVIIGAAPCANADYIKTFAENAFIICTDGGIKTAASIGITPNLVIGDFDSAEGFAQFNAETVTLPREKDISDMQAAVCYAIEYGVKHITFTAATNGRADHYFANIGLLEFIAARGAVGVIADEQNRIFLHPTGKFSVCAEGYRYVSIIALDDVVGPITITGMKYPLNGAFLRRDNPIAISNEDITGNAVIEICKGRALLIYSNDKNRRSQ